MALNLEKQLTFVRNHPPPLCCPSPLRRLFLLAPSADPKPVGPWIQYGAYHHNAVNIGIHTVCVPLILFSGFTMVGPPLPSLLDIARVSDHVLTTSPRPTKGRQLWHADSATGLPHDPEPRPQSRNARSHNMGRPLRTA